MMPVTEITVYARNPPFFTKEFEMNKLQAALIRDPEGAFLTRGGLLFKGVRTTLQHGDRIVYHSSGYKIQGDGGEVDMGYLEVKRNEELLVRQVGETRFPFDNRFHGGCPSDKEPMGNLLGLVLEALANMSNLSASMCRSNYSEGGLMEEEYKLVEPGCVELRTGEVLRP